MTKRQSIGWVLIYTAIISWIMNWLTGTVLSMHGGAPIGALLIWTYGTVPVLLAGILLAIKYPPNDIS